MRPALIAPVCVINFGCNAQDPMTTLANSHIEANAPKGAFFDAYLKRDLTAYFCKGQSDCRVEYEYLRQGATQSGISYPKYYPWTRCFTKDQVTADGAVRVAAVDQKYFDVTNYLSAKEIISSPEEVGTVFPAALVDKIVEKAKH
jgi:hypothetical protein